MIQGNHVEKAYRYKINLHDNCTGPHNDRCYFLHGKVSRLYKMVNDGSGIFDLYTSDHFRKVFENKSDRLKIGWIVEPRSLHSRMYDSVEKNLDIWFGPDGFDYIFTHEERLLQLHPKFLFLLGNGVQIKVPRLYKKSKLCSMISSSKTITPGHIDRLKYVEKFRNDVDLYGNGFNYIPLKEQGLVEYMFSIAIENYYTDVWITEKVLDCFATGTIPVYGGTKKISNFFNPNGIIFLDEKFNVKDLNEDLYYSKMGAVKENLERVREIEMPIDFMFNRFIDEYKWVTNL